MMRNRIMAENLVTVRLARLVSVAALMGLGACSSWLHPGVHRVPQVVAFDEHEIELGFLDRPTLLTGQFAESELAQLAVVHVESDGDIGLRLYGFEEDTWRVQLETTLPDGTEFVDVAPLEDRDALILYHDDRLWTFDPHTDSERELLRTSCSFQAQRDDEIPHVDVTSDLNGDGRTDLVVPTEDGFWIATQDESGKFAPPILVGMTPNLARIYGADGYRYDPWSQSRIHLVDFDGDGAEDLVAWNGSRFEVHSQDAFGAFAALSLSVRTRVDIDADTVEHFAEGEGTGRVLHSLGDFNADGVCDLALLVVEGKRASKKTSHIDIHYGERSASTGTRFASEVGARFQTKGRVQVDLTRHDFDHDGRDELVITTINVERLHGSLWKSFKGFMGDDIGFAVEFYRLRDHGYPAEPDAIVGLGLDGIPSHREAGSVPLEFLFRGGKHEARRTSKIWPNAFNNIFYFGDVDGDGLSDVVRSSHPRHLDLFVGVEGRDIFDPDRREVRIDAPNDEEYAQFVDLDGNGKQDLVLNYPFTERDLHGARKRPPGTEPHRVRILLSP